MDGMLSWVWAPEVWLPPGWTWESLLQADTFTYPVYQDIWTYPFVIAVFMLVLRYFVLYPKVFVPVGRWLGVKENRPRMPTHINALEGVFKMLGAKLPPEVLVSTASESGLSERQVERWLRQRASATNTSNMTKFCDLAWDCTYYSFYFVLGLCVLWNQDFLWDITYCFINFPEHSVAPSVWWYYQVALGYYWSMTATHFFGHKRKDAAQMLAHHILTIILMNLSWACNFVRIGALVLLVHECADIPMHLAKMCKLFGRSEWMDPFFVVFILLWLSTRVGLYPFWILRTTLFRAHVVAKMFYPVYYIFNSMLLLLLLLHIYWTYLIIRIVVNKFTSGQGTPGVQDVRSDSDASSEADENDYLAKKES